MIVTFAYTDDSRYTESYAEARKNRKALTFSIDVADVSAVAHIGAPSFKAELRDGGLWQLKSPRRKRQSVTTKPDLLLNGVKVEGHTSKNKKLIAGLLENWFFARARWIATDEVKDLNAYLDLVKVIPTSDELIFEKFENILFAQQCTIEYETAGAYVEPRTLPSPSDLPSN